MGLEQNIEMLFMALMRRPKLYLILCLQSKQYATESTSVLVIITKSHKIKTLLVFTTDTFK